MVDKSRDLITCVRCQRPCDETAVRTRDKHYHYECFQCAIIGCSRDLVTCGFFSVGDKLLCRDDYHKLLGTKCQRCDGFLEGVAVSALGARFHPECFRCESCRVVFASGSEICYDGKRMVCERCQDEGPPRPPPPKTKTKETERTRKPNSFGDLNPENKKDIEPIKSNDLKNVTDSENSSDRLKSNNCRNSLKNHKNVPKPTILVNENVNAKNNANSESVPKRGTFVTGVNRSASTKSNHLEVCKPKLIKATIYDASNLPVSPSTKRPQRPSCEAQVIATIRSGHITKNGHLPIITTTENGPEKQIKDQREDENCIGSRVMNITQNGVESRNVDISSNTSEKNVNNSRDDNCDDSHNDKGDNNHNSKGDDNHYNNNNTNYNHDDNQNDNHNANPDDSHDDSEFRRQPLSLVASTRSLGFQRQSLCLNSSTRSLNISKSPLSPSYSTRSLDRDSVLKPSASFRQKGAGLNRLQQRINSRKEESKRVKLPTNIDPERLRMFLEDPDNVYLEDSEFLQLFNVTREKYYVLPKCERQKLKDAIVFNK